MIEKVACIIAWGEDEERGGRDGERWFLVCLAAITFNPFRVYLGERSLLEDVFNSPVL